MPTLGIEREFQQRERQSIDATRKGSREKRMAEVLRKNPHLARSVCFLLSVGGMPAYVIVPTSRDVLECILNAIEKKPTDTPWALVVGRAGPMASPSVCGGIIAPVVYCDQLYEFTTNELVGSLVETLEPVTRAKGLEPARVSALGEELFDRIAASIDNVGLLDSHRALNYLLVQHPGLFLAYAERNELAVLDSIETRLTDSPGLRRVVTVVLTFLDRATGVPERVFTRVDTTEEWPFLADVSNGGTSVLALRPFIDNGLQGTIVS
jgi:hypothetical protein